MSELYPVTIVKTRYGGVYEGGTWAAFDREPDELPPGWDGDDMTCSAWWGANGERFGVGPTPEAALAELERRSTA